MTQEADYLRVKDLRRIYSHENGRSFGVSGFSIRIPRGAFFTMLGPSGCGKTTTLRCIAGLEEPEGGSIEVGDRVFFDASTKRSIPINQRQVGMVFQSYAIWPHMSVFENVAFPLRVSKGKRLPGEAIEKRVSKALEAVDLAGYALRSATQLSGGQQQRVALARAIVLEPTLLLLDEPLSNLDASLRDTMRTELKRLQSQLGVTTVYVTHDQTEALEMSDVVAVMDRGQIVQFGPPEEIYFRPRNIFVAGFVGTTNLVPGIAAGPVEDGGYVQVQLGDGQQLVCACVGSAPASSKLLVSVRPEAAKLVEASEPAPAETNRVSGTVESVQFLGGTRRYMVRTCGVVMRVDSDRDVSLDVGQAIRLDISHRRAVAFA